METNTLRTEVMNQNVEYGFSDSPFEVLYHTFNSGNISMELTILRKGELEFHLAGDHREVYEELSKKGWQACVSYWLENKKETEH